MANRSKLIQKKRTMELDVNNFENFTPAEYRDNLLRLGIVNYSDLVGKKVWYVTPECGVHTVEAWDADAGKYLLDLEGDKYWSNPFRILHCCILYTSDAADAMHCVDIGGCRPFT